MIIVANARISSTSTLNFLACTFCISHCTAHCTFFFLALSSSRRHPLNSVCCVEASGRREARALSRGWNMHSGCGANASTVHRSRRERKLCSAKIIKYACVHFGCAFCVFMDITCVAQNVCVCIYIRYVVTESICSPCICIEYSIYPLISIVHGWHTVRYVWGIFLKMYTIKVLPVRKSCTMHRHTQ